MRTGTFGHGVRGRTADSVTVLPRTVRILFKCFKLATTIRALPSWAWIRLHAVPPDFVSRSPGTGRFSVGVAIHSRSSVLRQAVRFRLPSLSAFPRQVGSMLLPRVLLTA